MMTLQEEVRALREAIERRLVAAPDPADVLPLLARLGRLAPQPSGDGAFAHRHIARMLLETHPWRATLHAKQALAQAPQSDEVWALLGRGFANLGHFRAAARAFERAASLAPEHPDYGFSLGCIVDVALDQPRRALPLLRRASERAPESCARLGAYVHALARTGQVSEARGLAQAALARVASPELAALVRWLDRGGATGAASAIGVGDTRPARRRGCGPSRKDLERELQGGLRHLPLTPTQRRAALVRARDPRVAALLEPPSHHVAAPLAAAIAYSVVVAGAVPLSAAEVAAPFRVGVSDLRGRFSELQAYLNLASAGFLKLSNVGSHR